MLSNALPQKLGVSALAAVSLQFNWDWNRGRRGLIYFLRDMNPSYDRAAALCLDEVIIFVGFQMRFI